MSKYRKSTSNEMLLALLNGLLSKLLWIHIITSAESCQIHAEIPCFSMEVKFFNFRNLKFLTSEVGETLTQGLSPLPGTGIHPILALPRFSGDCSSSPLRPFGWKFFFSYYIFLEKPLTSSFSRDTVTGTQEGSEKGIVLP